MADNKTHHFSIGICAYNEEKNIGKLIKSIHNQSLDKRFKLYEILIVASGCTDKTVNIVNRYKIKYNNIKLIIQKERRGKARAVNLIIQKANTKLIILQSADILLDHNCYSFLLSQLIKKKVGMVGGRVYPTDNPNTVCGFSNHLKWKLHHLINIKFPERPKVGELVAFKKIFKRIPPNTAVDEASIEPLIKLQDYKVIYEPKAIIYNHGPETIRELLSQRRRIFAGHFETKIHYGYEVITFSNFLVLPVFISTLEPNLKNLAYSFFTVILEMTARFFGYIDIKYLTRNHTIWKTIKSSKEVRLKNI